MRKSGFLQNVSFVLHPFFSRNEQNEKFLEMAKYRRVKHFATHMLHKDHIS
jgi:hypothetical protein